MFQCEETCANILIRVDEIHIKQLRATWAKEFSCWSGVMKSRRKAPDLLAKLHHYLHPPCHQTASTSESSCLKPPLGARAGGLEFQNQNLSFWFLFCFCHQIRINYFSPLWIKSVKYSLHFSLLLFYLFIISWRDLAAHSLCSPAGCTLPCCLRRYSNDPPSPTTCCGCCFRSGLVWHSF